MARNTQNQWNAQLAWSCLLSAVIAIGLHHVIKPHGEDLELDAGQTITITRTFNGYRVDGPGGASYNAKAVTIRANDYNRPARR